MTFITIGHICRVLKPGPVIPNWKGMLTYVWRGTGEFIDLVMPFYSKKFDDELIPLLWIPELFFVEIKRDEYSRGAVFNMR